MKILPFEKFSKVRLGATINIFLKSIPILIIGMLFSCKNDLEKVKAFANDEEFAFQTTYNVTYTFTKNGQIQNQLIAGEVNRFGADSGRIEISNGFKVLMYDSLAKPESELTAQRGTQYATNNMLIARDSVKFTNQLGEMLETSLLIMDRDSALIYTDKQVKITRGDNVIYGDGLRANESFSNYTIKNPRGSFYVKDEEF
jgi:LPS export ABC transporter protein LptC